MTTEKRIGCQTPTQSFILPYENTKGDEAINIYNSTSRTAQEWQELLLYDILATNEDGLWTHTKFGYSVPRRNGKNEIVAMRELFGLLNGETILHTAHLTSTSSAASKRLAQLLKELGYEEVIRVRKEVKYEKAFSYSKQFGLERIKILTDNGGQCNFRTRTSTGGLGEGFDLLIIDEAQEYQKDQESTLKYVVSDSKNPQTIFCGTPPTMVSKGTIFPQYRKQCLSGSVRNGAWAEWSVEEQSDVHDVDLWYQCNPAMGYQLNERKVADEIGDDEVDFNIQRLGWWATFNQKSCISVKDWEVLKAQRRPKFVGELFVGIKYGKSNNVALAVACRTEDEKVYVECIDCKNQREGNRWIHEFLKNPHIHNCIIDGRNGQAILKEEFNDLKYRKYIFPSVAEIIQVYAMFEKGLFEKNILHGGQQSVINAVTNVEKRAIGTNGGFGYKSIKEGCEVALVDAIALAYWSCITTKKEKTKQKVSY